MFQSHSILAALVSLVFAAGCNSDDSSSAVDGGGDPGERDANCSQCDGGNLPDEDGGVEPLESFECGGAVSHGDSIAKSSPAKPGYLQSYVDPDFGATITRISGNPGDAIPVVGGNWGNVCRNNYMKYQSWNADMSLIYLSWGCDIFLDGNTLQPAFRASHPGRWRWHPTEPEWIIYLDDNELGRWNPRTDEEEVIKVFSGYSGLTFELEGNLSHDGDWLAPHGTGPSGDNVTFAYQISTDFKSEDIQTPSPLDWVTISASGKQIIVNANWCNDPEGGTTTDRLKIYDSSSSDEIGDLNCGYGLPSHQDQTLDNEGKDVIVGIAKSGEHEGETIMRRLSDGQIRPIGPGGSHTGTRATRRVGWAFVQDPGGTFENELVAQECTWDGSPRMERLAYIPNIDNSYDSQTYGVVSPDGKKFLTGANWGDAQGPVQSYLVDFGALCP